MSCEGGGGAGNLYVVATPIGNLEDLTPRAERVLGMVDIVAAEDTRLTGRLLKHFEIEARELTSFHEHNEESRSPELADRIASGESVALVTDAGTPGISDPGFRLVRECRRRDIRILAVPGPCAAVAALSVSGMPTDRFAFLGFPPRGNALVEWLDSHLAMEMTLVFYEGPSRILHLLRTLVELAPDSPVSLSREITKLYEDTRCDVPSKLLRHYEEHREQLRGEFTCVIGPTSYRLEREERPGDQDHASAQDPALEDESVLMGSIDLLLDSGYRPSEAVAVVARGHKVNRSDLYRSYQQWRDAARDDPEG